MQGLSPHTIPVFNSIRNLDILKDYYLIGGTALSLQIQNRLSEDLDFCKWQDDPAISKPEVEWPKIESELKKFGSVRTDILDLNQVDFSLNGIKLSFYSKHRMSSKMILSILSDGKRFKYEERFSLLEPKYIVRSEDIESYLCEEIVKVFGARDRKFKNELFFSREFIQIIWGTTAV